MVCMEERGQVDLMVELQNVARYLKEEVIKEKVE